MRFFGKLMQVFSRSRRSVADWENMSAGQLRAAGSPIGILAEQFSQTPGDWLVQSDRLIRNGVEVRWKVPVSSASIIVKIDGKNIRLTRLEADVLSSAVATYISHQQAT